MNARSLVLVAILFFPLLSIGCATTPVLQPTIAFSGPGSTVPALQGKKVLVMGPLSLKKLAQLDVHKVIDDKNAERRQAGKSELSGLAKYTVRNTPFYLTLSAQFSHIVADALRKSGIEATHLDETELSPETPSDREALIRDWAASGFEYFLIAGAETSRVPGKSIFTEEKHGAKNLLVRLATLGLVPVHTSTFSLNYDRVVELTSTAVNAKPFTQTFPTDYAYDETVNSMTHGFKYPERFARDLNMTQQKDIEAILDWLKKLEL